MPVMPDNFVMHVSTQVIRYQGVPLGVWIVIDGQRVEWIWCASWLLPPNSQN